MIDVENAVFNKIVTATRTQFLTDYPNLTLYGEYVEVSEKFPCVSVWQEDNYTTLSTREIATTDEPYVTAMFHTEIQTVGQDRKAVAKKLANFVDAEFRGMGFTRLAMMVLPNIDRNAFRITMRHQGLVQKPIEQGKDQLISLIYR